nr:BRO family protein [Burkholderia ubonensis]
MNLRTVEIDGAPWFVAKDVCDALGIATPATLCRR